MNTDRHPRPRRGRGHRHRHGDRDRPDRRPAARARSPEPTPLQRQINTLEPHPGDHRRRRHRRRLRPGPDPRAGLRRPVRQRGLPRRGRHPGRAARGGRVHPGHGHRPARQARRHRQAAGVGGDAGQHLADLHRQDRHADAQPDDRAGAAAGRAAGSPSPARATPPTGGSAPPTGRRCPARSTRRCSPWRCAPTRCCATARSWAIRPRARWWCWPRRAASTSTALRQRTARACWRSRSTPTTSSWPPSTDWTDDRGRDVVRCFVKGAPDVLAGRADRYLGEHGVLPFDDAARARYDTGQRRAWPSRACG